MCNGSFLRNHRLAKTGLAERAIYTMCYGSPVEKAFSVVSSILVFNCIHLLITFDSISVKGILLMYNLNRTSFFILKKTHTEIIYCLKAFLDVWHLLVRAAVLLQKGLGL